MKTLNYNSIGFFVFTVIILFAQNLSAQQNDKQEFLIKELDTLAKVTDQQSFENLVCSIILDEDFEYRNALKKAKASKKYYVFPNKKISEFEILKHFKKAARHSKSVQEFMDYFYSNKLDFMGQLNPEDLSSLYVVFRKGTLDAFLQKLDSSFSHLY